MESIIRVLKDIEESTDLQFKAEKVPALETFVGEAIVAIQASDDLSNAMPYFDILQGMQFVCARLLFKDKIALSDNLSSFVRDFDRLDDNITRAGLFKKIKDEKNITRAK